MQGMAGKALLGEVSCGGLRQAGSGGDGRGRRWCGRVWSVEAWQVRHGGGWRAAVRPGLVWQASESLTRELGDG